MKYSKIDYEHIIRNTSSLEFHLHKGCEIYYCVSGDVKYFVENRIYTVEPGDVFITNQNEIHKPNFESDKTYERITIHFDPAFFSQFSNNHFDLLACFYNRRNGYGNKISLSESQLANMMGIFEEIENTKKHMPEYSEIKLNNLMIELLIFLNEVSTANRIDSEKEKYTNQLDDVLYKIINYIDQNPEGDLSLENLEKIFFISRAHLCRRFKAQTNSTLHQYIVKKRISRAKLYLEEGASVTHTMNMCGFGDFSNFIRTFKKNTGMTPSEYRQLSRD